MFIVEGKLFVYLEVICFLYKGKCDVMVVVLECELGDCMIIYVLKGGMFFWLVLLEGVFFK